MSRNVSNWIEGFVEYLDVSESPESYKRWVGFSLVAACLRRKCRLDWGLETFYPNLYVVLVGPSGVRKGGAMRPGAALLDELGIKKASEAITREALIRELNQSTDSVIVDGVAIIHSSLTVFSQELTVFLGYNNLQLMSDLADWFDCANKWVYRTKHQGTDEITGVWLNLIGATTPQLLQTALPRDAIGLGLTGRIIFIFEQHKGKDVSEPELTQYAKDMKRKLLLDMEKMSMMVGEFKVTEAFRERWRQWYPSCTSDPPFEDNNFQGYLTRRGTHMMKLSMVSSAARSDSLVVDVQDFDYALAVLTQAEYNMPRTFGGIGQSDDGTIVYEVMTAIALAREIEYKDLLKRFWKDANRKTLDLAIDTIAGMGACEVVFDGTRKIVRCTDSRILSAPRYKM